MCKYPNGFIVQDIRCPTNIVKSFNYKGVNAYDNYPLMSISTQDCREISNRTSVLEVSKNEFEILEFISHKDDWDKYVKICRDLSIPVRSLFVESEYYGELWKGSLPQLHFIGYEYCSLPIDCQIITDMDWCPVLRKHIAKLNDYGLFRTEEDAVLFKNDYLEAQSIGYVGDGDMQAYILRVSVVD